MVIKTPILDVCTSGSGQDVQGGFGFEAVQSSQNLSLVDG